jgi:predicted Ser/Thr protein kinase
MVGRVLESRAATRRETHLDLVRLYADDDAPRIPGIEIVSEIGRGGMGIVYRANQTNLEREVAVKVIACELLDDPLARTRFQREAKILARLDHPAIVRIHDWGETDQHGYIIMELVEGAPLGSVLSPSDAVVHVLAVCDALAHAHRHGIVHRDIKPSNVLVAPGGRVKLVDFGIASLATQPAITANGWAGTPKYMAPEAFTGSTDPRLDVYSVAMLLRTLIAPAAMPADLDAVIRRALAIDPGARPRSIDALAGCLRRVHAGTPPTRRRTWGLATATLCTSALALAPHTAAAPETASAPAIVSPHVERSVAAREQPTPTAPRSDGRAPSAVPTPAKPTVRAPAPKPRPAAPPPATPPPDRSPATLTLRIRPWADVSVDGAASVRTEPPRTVLELPPGGRTRSWRRIRSRSSARRVRSASPRTRRRRWSSTCEVSRDTRERVARGRDREHRRRACGPTCARASAALAAAQDAFHDDDLERAGLRLDDARAADCSDARLASHVGLWRAAIAFARGDRATARATIAGIDREAVVGLDEFWPSFVELVGEVRSATAAPPAPTVTTAEPAPVTTAEAAPALAPRVPPLRSRADWFGGGLVLRSTHDRTIATAERTTRASRTGSGAELVAGTALAHALFGEARATVLAFRDVQVDDTPVGSGAGFIASTSACIGWRWRLSSHVGGTVYAVASGDTDRGGGEMLAPRTVLAGGVGASVELRWRSWAVHAGMQWAPTAWAIEHAAPGDTVDVSSGAIAVGVRWSARPGLEVSAGITTHNAFETTSASGMRTELDDRRTDLGVVAELRR